MNFLFWGLTISMIGKVMVAVGVIVAHSKIAHEQKIDQQVLRSFRIEMALTVTGLLLIIGGYMMELYFYNFIDLLTCFGEQCAMDAAAILSQ